MIEYLSAVALRSEDTGEFDRRVTIYTKEMGKLKAKVAGVKKSISKLRPLAIPFVESRLQVYLHGTRRAGLHDPGKIVGGEVVNARGPLRNEWERMIQCSAFCETLDTLTHPCYPNPEEYRLLISTMDQLETTSNPLLVRLRGTLILLKILGYSLRHHSAWKAFSVREKQLLTALAKWDSRTSGFAVEETEELERITHSYLSLYLSRPLKTDLFRNKMEAALAPAAEE